MIIMYLFPLVGQVSVQESEELVINTLVTFNNLSYYADLTSTDSSGLSTVTEELTTGIYTCTYVRATYIEYYVDQSKDFYFKKRITTLKVMAIVLALYNA